MNLPKAFKNRVRLNESLGSHTSFRIGGRAQVWYEPKDREELIRFLKTSSHSPPIFVIGEGSNLLIREGILEKVFIRLNSPSFTQIKIQGKRVKAGAGVPISRLISAVSSHDLGGYEFLAGIPGSLGGALAMNAGARRDLNSADSYRQIGDIVSEVEVLDRRGRHLKLKKDDLRFSYRSSNLKPYIILSATLKLNAADKGLVRRKVKKIILARRRHQEGRYPSAGSFFKNLKNGEPAGRLIDLCGLKGLKVGGAQISRRHANFIINVGGAKSTDVTKLMEIIKKKVYNQFKIRLKPEVEIVS